MKKILIPLGEYKTNPDSNYPLFVIRHTYTEKLYKYNLIPVFIPPNCPPNKWDFYLEDISGVLFWGGPDISPELYSHPIHPKTINTDIQRDFLEFNLLKIVLERKIPFLGICRGCQMLNIVLGGTLTQEISEITNETHSLSPAVYDNLKSSKLHNVYIEKGSKIYKITKAETIKVNSGHHQCIKDLGKNLLISGKSESGIPEIIEHIDKDYFCFGVQSHPEFFNDSDLESIFESFAGSF